MGLLVPFTWLALLSCSAQADEASPCVAPPCAISWQAFHRDAAVNVRVRQSSARSGTPNPALGPDASPTFGKSSANGQVFLAHPQGIYFAPGAQVDVGGLVANTHRIGCAFSS